MFLWGQMFSEFRSSLSHLISTPECGLGCYEAGWVGDDLGGDQSTFRFVKQLFSHCSVDLFNVGEILFLVVFFFRFSFFCKQ
jgi:hypothetical protein